MTAAEVAAPAAHGTAPRSRDTAPAAPAPRRRRGWAGPLGLVPFLLYTGIFLLLPTLLVVVGAFRSRDGALSLNGLELALQPRTLDIFWTSTWLSAVTALIGAVLGGVVAYALATAPESNPARRVFVALNSVLAQFGGVMLAFAFVATIGTNGMLTRLVADLFGGQISPAFLSTLPGLVAVYTYFQVPLMVIVFLPACEGLRPQWREATMTFGGTTWDYLRRVVAPVLAPSFLGSFLLLFANAFSAFATAAALISQQTIIVPMEIESAIRNENNLGMDAYAQSLALGMIIVIAIVMTLYAWLQRRAARWTGE